MTPDPTQRRGTGDFTDYDHDIERDTKGITAAGIFFAFLGVIGSIGAWFIMIPVLIVVLGVSLAVGASPKMAAYKTLAWAGTILAGIAVVGLAIFAFLFAVCLMESPRGFMH